MRRPVLFSLLVFLGLLSGWPHHANAAPIEGAAFYSLNSNDALIQEYENPGRAAWQKPEKVVEHLSIKPGSVIADIGSGTGYFSVLLASKTGEHGIVYAVDNDREMIAYLEKRIKKDGHANIKPVLARTDDPMLPKTAVDLIFICNTYMFFQHREQYLMRLKENLKNEGRLAIVSFNNVEAPEGPPLHTRVSREKTILEAKKAGFVLEAEYFFLPYQHYLIFVKR